MNLAPPTTDIDVAIIGFGFSGLATLMNLAREGGARSVAVVAPDRSGHGLAYSTTRPFHLLNVVAERMGAWADDEEHFAGWLDTGGAAAACEEMGVSRPGPGDFAPRALFARYLDELRDTALRRLADDGVRLHWIAERAQSLVPAGDGWEIRAETTSVRARRCVLAVGNDVRHVFGELRDPRLLDGPWAVRDADLPSGSGPVVLIGAGLTAVDAMLSLRAGGHREEVIALSRHGLLPRAHDHALRPLEVAEEEMTGVRTLADVVRFVSARHAAGHDWREVIDGLRPYTVATWQGLSAADQCQVVERWASIWNVYRHRMAPAIAARVDDEIAGGGLRVQATSRLEPIVADGGLEIQFASPEGMVERIRPALVIDCTGPQLDPARSEQPLLRGLVTDGVAARHHSGLGFLADDDLQIAPGLHAIGSLLTGQLWETVAVPELREQAAVIAAAIGRGSAGVRRGRAA
jgi:uncharacterized NAD(P)/FAD-binding protein YdhS